MAKGGASKVFVWIILGLLIVGLAGFGATNFGGSVRAVATVGDTEIDVDRYARRLQQDIRAFSAETGRALTVSQAQDIGLTQSVLASLVNLAALEDEAASLGISVGDAVVRQQVLDIPAFRGLNGEFDREAYQFVLDNQGLTIAEFEDRIRIETSASIVQNAIAAGVVQPDVFAETVRDFIGETRDVTWARLDETRLSGTVEDPDEAALNAFYEANPELFTLPEARSVTYAWLTPSMLAGTIEPDEATLRELYEIRIDEFMQPERRLVERLVFPDEAAAADALARLDAGEVAFEDLVAERDLTLADIDLGDVTEAELGPAGEAVFALTEPGVAGPAASNLGPALFRMNAILAARDVPFEVARTDLVEEAVMDRARRIILDSISDYDDLLAGGATLEELADETEMELGQIDWTGEETDGIAAYQAFREALAELREGDFPEIIELEDGGVFALRLDEVVPPRLQPLADVRDTVIEGWRVEETSRRLAGEAETVAQEIRDGREMAAVRLPLGTDRGLGRDSFIEGTPGNFVSQVFEMADGEVRVIPDEGQAWIVRLDRIVPADPADAEMQAITDLLTRQASQGVSTDLLNAFTRALQVEKGITVNQTAINAVHAQFP